MNAYAEYMSRIDLDYHERLDSRRTIARICGDCGVQWTTNDTCQWCGGLATPLRNRILVPKEDR
jgi:hypothetical protein